MLRVEIHPNAEFDIEKLVDEGLEHIAAEFLAIAEQMEVDEDLQDRLLVHESTHEGLEVKHWWSEQKKGNNLWRLKVVESEVQGIHGYRMIYGYIPRQSGIPPRYCIIGVPKRSEFDYGRKNTEIERRILRDFEDL